MKLKKDSDIFEALKASFIAEKKQYVLYKRLAGEFYERSSVEIVTYLANEERKHAIELAAEHNRLIIQRKKMESEHGALKIEHPEL